VWKDNRGIESEKISQASDVYEDAIDEVVRYQKNKCVWKIKRGIYFMFSEQMKT
jgi:hypothetical protein